LTFFSCFLPFLTGDCGGEAGYGGYSSALVFFVFLIFFSTTTSALGAYSFYYLAFGMRIKNFKY
jgi:hypothetical protein